MKTSRPPMNVPSRGDRCRLRGRAPTGVLRTLDDETLWACVAWDEGRQGPRFVHLFELEKEAK